MAAVFALTVLTPDKNFFSGEVGEIVFSTPEGAIGIMAGHEPMIASVMEGTMEILADGEWKIAAVGPGFGEITYDHAEFYLDTVEWSEEIDVVRAREALERAENRMHSNISNLEFMRTKTAMSRALARLKVAEESMTRTRRDQ